MKTVTFTLRLTEEVHDRLRALQKRDGGVTVAEILRRALACYEAREPLLPKGSGGANGSPEEKIQGDVS